MSNDTEYIPAVERADELIHNLDSFKDEILALTEIDTTDAPGHPRKGIRILRDAEDKLLEVLKVITEKQLDHLF